MWGLYEMGASGMMETSRGFDTRDSCKNKSALRIQGLLRIRLTSILASAAGTVKKARV